MISGEESQTIWPSMESEFIGTQCKKYVTEKMQAKWTTFVYITLASI